MSKKTLLIAVACLPLLALQGFSASFMKIETEKQDQYKGGSKAKGHEGWIELISFHAAEPSGVEKKGAAQKGKREHAMVTVTKQVGEHSAELKAAMDGKSKLLKVTIEEEVGGKGALGAKGKEDKPISILLTNAVITKVSVAGEAKGAKGKEKETIEFSYQKIEWTRSSGKTFSDSWEANAN